MLRSEYLKSNSSEILKASHEVKKSIDGLGFSLKREELKKIDNLCFACEGTGENNGKYCNSCDATGVFQENIIQLVDL